MEIRATSEECDSGLSLKKRHYGKHRSSLLYGGFVGSALSFDRGSESRTSEQQVEEEATKVKLNRYSVP